MRSERNTVLSRRGVYRMWNRLTRVVFRVTHGSKNKDYKRCNNCLSGKGVKLHLKEGRRTLGGSITGFWESLYVPSHFPFPTSSGIPNQSKQGLVLVRYHSLLATKYRGMSQPSIASHRIPGFFSPPLNIEPKRLHRFKSQ